VQVAQLVYEAPEHLGILSQRFFRSVLGCRIGGYTLVCGVFRDFPPAALRVPFSFYLSGLESLQEIALGDLEYLRRL